MVSKTNQITLSICIFYSQGPTKKKIIIPRITIRRKKAKTNRRLVTYFYTASFEKLKRKKRKKGSIEIVIKLGR